MYKGERFNSISHLVGAALALADSAVRVIFAAMDSELSGCRFKPRKSSWTG